MNVRRNFIRALLVISLASSSAFADHVPPVGLDSKGTWAVLIAVAVIFAMLVLSLIWAVLDGQFSQPERVKYRLLEPDRDWPYGRGTSIERPEA